MQFLQNAARSRHLVVGPGSARFQSNFLFFSLMLQESSTKRLFVVFSASLRTVILSHLLDQKVAVTIGVLVRHGQGKSSEGPAAAAAAAAGPVRHRGTDSDLQRRALQTAVRSWPDAAVGLTSKLTQPTPSRGVGVRS